MTTLFWVQMAQWALGAMAVMLLWSLRAGIRGGQWMSEGQSLKEWSEQANERMSKLTSILQSLPDVIRHEADLRYMAKDLSEERWRDERRHREAIEERVRALEIQLARARGGGR